MESGLEIRVTKYYPSRQTEFCYFVVSEHEKFLIKIGGDRLKRREKRILKNSVKRFCYPTKREALYSFKKRKMSQVYHAEFSLAKATQSLKFLSEYTDEFDIKHAGRPDFWDTLNFDC